MAASSEKSTGHKTTKHSDRALVIEARSIDYVPLSERHGRLLDQVTIWFPGGAQLLSLATGAIGIGLGLNLAWTLIGLLIGTILGTLPCAAHATQGPTLGLPQMVQSRPQFGRLGALFIWLMAIMVYWGYIVLGVNLLGATAEHLQLASFTPSGIIVGFLCIVLAAFGYRWLHAAQRYTAIIMLVILAIFALGIVFISGLPAEQIQLSGTFIFTPFLMVVVASLAYQLTWAFFVSDYSRYMPADTSSKSIIFCTASGLGVGVFSYMAVGAVGAALFPQQDILTALHNSGDLIISGFGAFLLIGGAIGLLTLSAMCVYGGALTLITAADSITTLSLTRALRIKAVLAIGISATIAGVLLPNDFIETTFYTVLTVLAYLMGPWTSVNLVDYFIVRKGRYSVMEIFNPNGMYGNWNWRGIMAYLIAFISMLPFMYLPFWQGPVAQYLDGIDFAFFVGIPVGAIAYWIFCRSLDLKAELALIASADKNLESSTQ
ncbi:cytosine permease [Ventosimonas gracilis]|uniref:Cytosine permease n=1 Tax=Ventosimonas gracilis TaxID=1680762 RepID=A0A139SRN8_9GAMM|nr:cytosine permease [Ventosimonas gracilis]KXU37246.1 cytosine permease [Ventosimonas gracilis]